MLNWLLSQLAQWLLGKHIATRLQQSAFSMYLTQKDRVYLQVDQPVTGRYRIMLLRGSTVYKKSTEIIVPFFDQPVLVDLSIRVPQLIEKPQRPYLRADFKARQWPEMMIYHYEYMMNHPVGLRMLTAASKGHLMASVNIVGKDNQTYVAKIEQNIFFTKEGEILINVTEAETATIVTQLICTVLKQNGEPALFIGNLQGTSGKEAITGATKAMYGLRPHVLVVILAQALAQALNISQLTAVSNKAHIYRHWRRRKTIQRDLDACWSDIGGVADASQAFYVIPLSLPDKPIEDYPSNKRGQARSRKALADKIKVDTFKAIKLIA